MSRLFGLLLIVVGVVVALHGPDRPGDNHYIGNDHVQLFTDAGPPQSASALAIGAVLLFVGVILATRKKS